MNNRLDDLKRFYEILGKLESTLGGYLFLQVLNEKPKGVGKRCLPPCISQKKCQEYGGVYFSFEAGENCLDSGKGNRVVRVGSHKAARCRCSRLDNHRGAKHGGTLNHSQLRYLLGEAIKKDTQASDASTLGYKVSSHVASMPFLWLGVKAPRERLLIESNSIAILSNYRRCEDDRFDVPSESWLGSHPDVREEIRCSGLWCIDHINERYDPNFLEILATYVRAHPKGGREGGK